MGYGQSHPLFEGSIGCHLKSILIPCDPSGCVFARLGCPSSDRIGHDSSCKEGDRLSIDYYSHDYRSSSVILSRSLAG